VAEREPRFAAPGPASGIDETGRFHAEEVALALRNHGIPLEGLRYPITPTGMHYLLVHFDIPEVDAASWRLQISGLVARTLTLTLDEIRSRPAVAMPVTMECAGNGRALMHPRPISQPWMGDAVGTAEWLGTPLRPLIEEAGVSAETVEIVFTGADKGVQGDVPHLYQRSLTLAEASRDEVLLAYEMNGAPLEPQHGFPLRLVVPGWYGMTSVKWLTMIEAIAEPFDGYQMVEAYRYTDSGGEPGEPVDLIRPRALMIPPGIPDFLTRGRLVEPGTLRLTGRAWAGRTQIAQVEVSTDGGASWTDAALDAPIGPSAWRGWSFGWDARPGRHVLRVRATDAQGNRQPESEWNLQGMGNNMCQRIDVLVEARSVSAAST
jgi:DMSO/TMAO reductase YedYZ molybdopterin-dependent catalytic subunit